MAISHADGIVLNSGGGDVAVGSLNSANSYAFVDKTSSAGAGSWDAARTEAKSVYVDGDQVGDSYLVTITSELENSIAALTAGYVGAWIGAHRPGGAGSGNWEWADGPEGGDHFYTECTTSGCRGTGSAVGSAYNNFGSGEPNGAPLNGEEVGQFFGAQGLWNDLRWETTYSATSGSYNVLGFIRETNLAQSTMTINASGGSLTKGTVGASKALTLVAAPDAPTGLAGSVSSRGGDVDLTWTAGDVYGSAISSYLIEARKNGTSSWSSVSDDDGNATDASATISGLDACTLYDFRISAVSAVGASPASSSTTALAFRSAGLTDVSASNLVLSEDATQASGVVTLTPNLAGKKGAAWSPFRVDLTNSFCLEADLRLSETNSRSGADGIAFVLQPTDTSTLSAGGGLGYLTQVKPSVAVEFDTFSNAGDSAAGQDVTLVTIDASSNVNSTAFGQANYDVTGDSYVLEDGNFHPTRVAYDSNSNLLTVLVDLNADGDFEDTGERTVDDVTADLETFFTNQASTTKVYWGWTAATGGLSNLQQVRNVKTLPASLPANTAPTATSPGAQTLDVGATTSVSVAIDDSGETTAAQWRLSVSSGNTSFATASVAVASSTSATVSLTGVADGDTTITLTAVDADGASVSTSFALRVGAGSPAAPASPTTTTTRTTTPTVVVPPVVIPAVPPRVTTTPGTAVPVVQSGPVLTRGVVPAPPKAPTVVLGGRPTLMSVTVPTTTQLDVKAGRLSLGVKVLEDQGTISEAPDGTTQIAVKKGASATISGSGFKPAATVQVFLPLDGDNAKELTRIPVAADGSFDGSAPFATKANEAPLPVGKQVLQLVSLDTDGNQVVVEMTVNIAQGAPAPEANRIEGVIPAMQPGQSIATSGGEPVPVTITPVSDQKLAVVEGDGWSMAVNVNSDQGGVEPAEGGALLKLVRNETALVSGSGFMAGTRADVWLFSDPTLLGTVTIDENGEFTGEVNIDPNMIPVGQHTLQLQGVGEDGYVKAANMGVLVDDPAEAVTDTATASLTLLWWIIAAVLVVLVLVVVLVSRRRRQA